MTRLRLTPMLTPVAIWHEYDDEENGAVRPGPGV